MTRSLAFVGILISFIASFYAPGAIAATPPIETMITWSSPTIVPPWYQGRALPNSKTPIEAKIILTAASRIIDTSTYTMRWFKNGILIANGRNLSRIVVLPDQSPSTIIRLRVTVSDETGTTISESTTLIELTQPRVVIDAPAPMKRVTNVPTTLTALPFYFSLKNQSTLLTQWFVDGVFVGSRPELTVATTAKTLPTAQIEASIEDAATGLESAFKTITLLPRL